MHGTLEGLHARHRETAATAALIAALGFVLADGGIVTLALPQLLRDLHTTVQGVAAVLAVYAFALAVALAAQRRLRRLGAARMGMLGFAVMSAASALCASSDSLGVLLGGRAAQAVGGAAGAVAAYEFVATSRGHRRLWLPTAVVAAALGPVLGGVLTQALDWRAIFIVQVPVAALAAVACKRLSAPGHPRTGPTPESGSARAAVPVPARTQRLWRPALALALVSAALSAVLFILVLVLVAGWGASPIGAALVVSVLPVATFAGLRERRGSSELRAAAGSALIAAGVLALAWLPETSIAWAVIPQVLAGVGMGLALPALAGELLPERDAHDAARLLTVRHAGIALALIALAPLIAHQLTVSTEQAKQRGVALLLDAPIPPQNKLELAPSLFQAVSTAQPRNTLRAAFAQHREEFTGAERMAYDQLAQRADATVIDAVSGAFHDAFLVTGLLAALAALVVGSRRVWRTTAAAVTASLVLAAPAAYAVIDHRVSPRPVPILDPCQPRAPPAAGGLAGVVQTGTLAALDVVACRLHTSREQLVLALLGDDQARAVLARQGLDVNAALSLLGLGGIGP